jgi:hypothetical protein
MPPAVKSRGIPFPPGMAFKDAIRLTGWNPPNIIDFCILPDYLNRPNLYPRQATLLKVMFLQTELLTSYDYDVIGEWTQNYLDTADEHGEGNNGMVPDVLERMRINRLCPCGHDRGEHIREIKGRMVWDQVCSHGSLCRCSGYKGRRWFRQTSNISGRRGSKGHIGAQAGAYVLWNYMGLSDPQAHFGVDRDKPLTGIVFAGKKDQALKNQWGDLNNVILGAPCFSNYISKPMGESLSVYSPWDYYRMQERLARGIQSAGDMATFQIVPKESTLMAGRGPASFMQFYDEMAHVVATGANRSAEEVYGSATPSLDQFKEWAFLYIPTSPWQKIGQSYVEYQQSIEVNEDGSPAYPEKLMVQLTSWDIYKDWEKASTIQSTPEGLFFQPLRGAIQDYDEQMQQLEKANPETFAVERRSRWATAMNAYLNADRVKEMWQPWPDVSHPMKQETRGILSKTYRAHGDPSKSGAGFGFAVAHIESVDDRGLPHVVFDQIRAWLPSDFEGGEIDYDVVERDLEQVVHDFLPSELTFDQFNSVGTIQRLQKYALRGQFPKRVQVYERTATGPLNWKTYETFKTAVNMGLVHGPYFELADLELTFLQDLGGKVEHPTSGPVQTKDVADCMAIVVYELIGNQMSAFIGKSLSDLTLQGAASGGFDPYQSYREPETAHSELSGFSAVRRGYPGGGRNSAARGGSFRGRRS